MIRTLFDRANDLVSSEEEKLKEIEHVKKALRLCGYPEWAFKRVEKQIIEKKTSGKKTKVNKKKDKNTSKGKVAVLPYVKGLSESVARIFRRFDRTACFKPASKLGQQLFQLKDKADPLKKANAIYKINCKNCVKSYT